MKRLIIIILIILSTSCIEIFKESNVNNEISESATVVKIIDGDTIDVLYNGEIQKIRLVGIDTPEPYSKNNTKKWYGLPNEHLNVWGIKAKDYAYERLNNKEVNISYDSIQGKKDEYGRTLAYIIVDRNNFNLELVENGYARVYTEKSSDLYWKLIEAQTKARINHVGLWDYSQNN